MKKPMVGSDYRQLAAFGDTVLAATYSEKNGFMFCI